VLSPVRTMTRPDVPSAMEMSEAAKWNQTPEDWFRLMLLSPDGCRCIEDAGQVVATATLLPYGTGLAWIGMVLTRLEYQRQGLARRLMEDAIAAAQRLNIRTLKLDATDEGRPLYESLGFVVEQSVERWRCDDWKPGAAARKNYAADSANEANPHGAQISDGIFSRDRAAFGISRKALLEALIASGRCDATGDGYVFSRPGSRARYLGPCVANSGATARRLISSHLESFMGSDENHEGFRTCSWYWDLLPANKEAANCAIELGFTRQRNLWRMRRGEVIENNDAMVYAIAGFELG
jgi:GNAT superfamily N-acetyltransferase